MTVNAFAFRQQKVTLFKVLRGDRLPEWVDGSRVVPCAANEVVAHLGPKPRLFPSYARGRCLPPSWAMAAGAGLGRTQHGRHLGRGGAAVLLAVPEGALLGVPEILRGPAVGILVGVACGVARADCQAGFKPLRYGIVALLKATRLSSRTT